MRVIATALMLLVFFFPSQGQKKTTHAPEKPPAEEFFLEMEGLIFLGAVKGPADLTIYKDTSVFLCTKSDKKGRASFKLPLEKIFIVQVSKDGYVSKRIRVDTRVPFKYRKNYLFRFEVDIFEDIPKLDVSVLKRPVAEIRYNIPNQNFLYDFEYTSKINKDLKKLYRDYYLLEKALNDSLVKTDNKK